MGLRAPGRVPGAQDPAPSPEHRLRAQVTCVPTQSPTYLPTCLPTCFRRWSTPSPSPEHRLRAQRARRASRLSSVITPPPARGSCYAMCTWRLMAVLASRSSWAAGATSRAMGGSTTIPTATRRARRSRRCPEDDAPTRLATSSFTAGCPERRA